MTRRKMMGVKESSAILPSEYQQVEWIASAGTSAIINTGINPNTYMRFLIEFAVDNFSVSNNSAMVMDSINGTSGQVRLVQQPKALYTKYFYGGGGTGRELSRKVEDGEWLTAKIEPSAYRKATISLVDSENNQLTSFTASGDTNSIGNNAQVVYFLFFGKVKRFICQNSLSEDLANHVPCYRKSDGIIGMYDIVTNTFFTNSGTGTFTKGADV